MATMPAFGLSGMCVERERLRKRDGMLWDRSQRVKKATMSMFSCVRFTGQGDADINMCMLVTDNMGMRTNKCHFICYYYAIW